MEPIAKLVKPILSHRNTPTVLVIASCVGVVVTAVMVHNAALHADAVLEPLRHGLGPDESVPFKKAFKATWKVYAPAVGVGAMTLAAIITMNRISARNAAILTTSATVAATTLKEYQRHILDEIGAERESKVRDRIAKDTLMKADFPRGDLDQLMLIDGGDDVIYLDKYSGRFFKSTHENVRKVENDLNHELLDTMYMPLNTLYHALGMEPIDAGDIVGFNTDNMISFHYSTQMGPNNKPVVVLEHLNPPTPDYYQMYS